MRSSCADGASAGSPTLSQGAEKAREALLTGDRAKAAAAVSALPAQPVDGGYFDFIVEHARTAGGDHQLNKALADFDFDAQRRLARTRLLVRAGPALGLMGTLIPLSPALTGLANGNTTALSQNLRVRLQRHGRRPAHRSGGVRPVALA